MAYQRPKRKPYPSLRKRVHRRAWLNESGPGGAAHIIWSVDPPKFSANTESKKKKKKKLPGWIHEPYTNLSIADCNRIISLDFEIDDKSTAHSFRKIDRLIRELQAFRVAMKRAVERKKELKLAHPGAE